MLCIYFLQLLNNCKILENLKIDNFMNLKKKRKENLVSHFLNSLPSPIHITVLC